jgi:hypothetical protein
VTGKARAGTSIKEAISDVMGRLRVGEATGEGPDACDALKNILTKEEREHIRITNFAKGIVYAHVDTSSWLYVCSLKKESYLKQVRMTVPAVRDIRFGIGDVHEGKGKRDSGTASGCA